MAFFNLNFHGGHTHNMLLKPFPVHFTRYLSPHATDTIYPAMNTQNSGPPLRIGLLGTGIVGSGVLTVLLEQGSAIAERIGRAIVVQRVASKEVLQKRAELPGLAALPADRLSTDFHSVVTAPDVDVVIELMGGINAAKTAILAALQAGKHVVTANKALLAEHGEEIFAAARAAGVCVAFEASCVGAVPIIGALLNGLQANRIESLVGIFNGTCNYILTGMSREGKAFDTVLKEAQAAGFAEADPTLDIDGHDTAHKLAVLSSLAFGANVHVRDVSVAGIRHVDIADIRFGQELGYALKLLAIGQRVGSTGVSPVPTLSLRVHPAFVPASHGLASVGGPFNAVCVKGSAADALIFQGRGAGSLPTASAVLADVIEIALGTAPARFRQLKVYNDQTPRPLFQPLADVLSRFYIRVNAQDRPGVMAVLTRAFAAREISLAAVIQHESQNGSPLVPVVVTTYQARTGDVQRAVETINKLPVVGSPAVVIPIQE